MAMKRLRKAVMAVLAMLLAGGSLAACSAGHDGELATPMAMTAMEQMPHEVQQAAERVQQAYQFSSANPEMAKQVPCYCNCGPLGHTSSYDCYVSGTQADGTLKFDLHATLCQICVDITQDSMRLLQEGKSAQQIRVHVENYYSRYGPSNME